MKIALLTVHGLQLHGGNFTSNQRKAHVILVNETRLKTTFEILQLSYAVNQDIKLRNLSVETTSFIDRCIGRGIFVTGTAQKGKSGRKSTGCPGGPRTEFNDDDDENLVMHLSNCPISAAKSGNKLYKQLWEMVSITSMQVTGSNITKCNG